MSEEIDKENQRTLRKNAVVQPEARRADVKTVDKLLMAVRAFTGFNG